MKNNYKINYIKITFYNSNLIITEKKEVFKIYHIKQIILLISFIFYKSILNFLKYTYRSMLNFLKLYLIYKSVTY